MTDYKMSSATIAFDTTVWPRCGVILRDQVMIFNRDAELDLIEWPIRDVQVNGPRSWIAYRVDDNTMITIVNSGGCGCR